MSPSRRGPLPFAASAPQLPDELIDAAMGESCFPGTANEAALLDFAPSLSGMTLDSERVRRALAPLLADAGVDYQPAAHPVVETRFLDPRLLDADEQRKVDDFRARNGLVGKTAIPWLNRPDPVKGFYFALQAVAKRVLAGDEDLVLYCARNPCMVDWARDPYLDRIVDLLSHRYVSRLDGRIHELGEHVRVVEKPPCTREERRTFLWAGDFFIAASAVESLGSAFVEQLAAGLPGVALDTGALSTLIAHGRSGFVMPFTREPDIDQLATYVGILRNDPERRRKMGRAATVDMQDRFDQETLTVRRERYHRRLIDQGQQARAVG